MRELTISLSLGLFLVASTASAKGPEPAAALTALWASAAQVPVGGSVRFRGRLDPRLYCERHWQFWWFEGAAECEQYLESLRAESWMERYEVYLYFRQPGAAWLNFGAWMSWCDDATATDLCGTLVVPAQTEPGRYELGSISGYSFGDSPEVDGAELRTEGLVVVREALWSGPQVEATGPVATGTVRWTVAPRSVAPVLRNGPEIAAAGEESAGTAQDTLQDLPPPIGGCAFASGTGAAPWMMLVILALVLVSARRRGGRST